jgi:hypothetical protein
MGRLFSGLGYSIQVPARQWLAFRQCTACEGTGTSPPSGSHHPTLQGPAQRCPIADCENGMRVCRATTAEQLKAFADQPDPK